MYVIIVVVGAVLECVVGVVEPLYNYVCKRLLQLLLVISRLLRKGRVFYEYDRPIVSL